MLKLKQYFKTGTMSYGSGVKSINEQTLHFLKDRLAKVEKGFCEDQNLRCSYSLHNCIMCAGSRQPKKKPLLKGLDSDRPLIKHVDEGIATAIQLFRTWTNPPKHTASLASKAFSNWVLSREIHATAWVFTKLPWDTPPVNGNINMRKKTNKKVYKFMW